MREIIFVVADKFRDFAVNHGVYIYSDLLEAMTRGDARLQDVRTVVLGQGLRPEEIKALEDVLVASYSSLGMQVFVPFAPPVPAALVHKHKPENVLVSTPQRVGQSEYRAWLSLDERCAEMSDHVTGQHVQGLVLVEASRQMMMAAVEMHAFQAAERGTYQYALNDITVRYEQFTFPLDVAIHMTILRCAREERTLDVELLVEFFQESSRVCGVRCTARGYPTHWLKRMEARKAQQLLSAARARFSTESEVHACYRRLGAPSSMEECA